MEATKTTTITCANSCPRFQNCNAPICPLDVNWHKRSNLRDDSTCFYLLESVKDGARTNFEGAQLGMMYERILTVRGDIESSNKRIKSKLESAEKSTSRMKRKFIATTNEVVEEEVNKLEVLGDLI